MKIKIRLYDNLKISHLKVKLHSVKISKNRQNSEKISGKNIKVTLKINHGYMEKLLNK